MLHFNGDDLDYLASAMDDDAHRLMDAANHEENKALRQEMLRMSARSSRYARRFRFATAHTDPIGDSYRKLSGEA